MIAPGSSVSVLLGEAGRRSEAAPAGACGGVRGSTRRSALGGGDAGDGGGGAGVDRGAACGAGVAGTTGGAVRVSVTGPPAGMLEVGWAPTVARSVAGAGRAGASACWGGGVGCASGAVGPRSGDGAAGDSAAGDCANGRGANRRGPTRPQTTIAAIDAVTIVPPTIAAFRFHRLTGPCASAHRRFRTSCMRGRSSGCL